MSVSELKSEEKFIDGKYDIREKLLQENPALGFLGVSAIYVKENGEAEIVLPLDRKHTNVHGFAHGGIYAALLDTAMGISCSYTNKVSCVTLDMTTSFISNCQPGVECVTVGRAVHIGRRIMVAEGEVFDNTGKLMVKGQGTFFVLGEHPYSAVKSPNAAPAQLS